jgi:hypothetical protein
MKLPIRPIASAVWLFGCFSGFQRNRVLSAHGDLESNRLPSLLMPNLTVVRWMRAEKVSFPRPMQGERLVEEPGCRHIALGGISSGPKGSDTQTVSTGAAY